MHNAGTPNAEIARALGVTTAVVSGVLYRTRLRRPQTLLHSAPRRLLDGESRSDDLTLIALMHMRDGRALSWPEIATAMKTTTQIARHAYEQITREYLDSEQGGRAEAQARGAQR